MNISISDNGIGMSDDQLIHVFNLFYRANQGFPGNGLGLYLVKSTLNILKGEITLKSRKGKGTKVLIKLKKHRLLNEN
jgi:signal transduction histidine kinase